MNFPWDVDWNFVDCSEESLIRCYILWLKRTIVIQSTPIVFRSKLYVRFELKIASGYLIINFDLHENYVRLFDLKQRVYRKVISLIHLNWKIRHKFVITTSFQKSLLINELTYYWWNEIISHVLYVCAIHADDSQFTCRSELKLLYLFFFSLSLSRILIG